MFSSQHALLFARVMLALSCVVRLVEISVAFEPFSYLLVLVWEVLHIVCVLPYRLKRHYAKDRL